MAVTSISNTVATAADYMKADSVSASVQAVNVSNQAESKDGNETKVTTNASSDAKDDDAKSNKEANERKLKSIIGDTNNKMKDVRRMCEFSYHADVNRVSIKVINADTKEVIKEIPPEKTIEMIEKIWDIAGLLVDEKR